MMLSSDAASWARASFSWALDPTAAHHMRNCLDKLSPAELVELTLAADVLLAEACKRIRDANEALVAAAVLTPDALPDGVEGFKIGVRG